MISVLCTYYSSCCIEPINHCKYIILHVILYLPCQCNANEEACLAANSSSRSVSCCVNRQSGCYGAARASVLTMTKLYRHYLPCFLQTAQLKKLCFLVKCYLEPPAVMLITVGANIMGIM